MSSRDEPAPPAVPKADHLPEYTTQISNTPYLDLRKFRRWHKLLPSCQCDVTIADVVRADSPTPTLLPTALCATAYNLYVGLNLLRDSMIH
jgi:hypothetical protein